MQAAGSPIAEFIVIQKLTSFLDACQGRLVLILSSKETILNNFRSMDCESASKEAVNLRKDIRDLGVTAQDLAQAVKPSRIRDDATIARQLNASLLDLLIGMDGGRS
jgi:hypothetical protein